MDGDGGGEGHAPSAPDAAERGRAIVAEARAVRRRMLDDAEQRRRALVSELERVRGEIDAAIKALSATDADGSADEPAARAPAPPGSVPTPQARPAARPSSDGPQANEPPRVAALFDALRAETPPPVPKRARPPTRASSAPSEEHGRALVATPAPAAPIAPDAEDSSAQSGDGGASPPPASAPVREGELDRRRRDASLAPLVPEVVRVSKRLLQDEQNSLLDAARRARGRHEPARLLPEPVRQRESWTALLAPSIDAAYLGGRAAAGKTRRVTSAPVRIVVELAALLVTPLRERVTATIESVISEGPYESPNELQRALGSAIGARYREWRTVDLEDHVVDVLAAAYARGAYDAAGPAALLRWVADEPGSCPDCDDNALEPTLKGKAFPTGQQHPPAHPGCRCLVLPVDV